MNLDEENRVNNLRKVLLGDSIRDTFPIFAKYGQKRLCFLDSAASTQKPKCVIDRLTDFYSNEYSNILRGAYELSANATIRYEEARSRISNFIGSKSSDSIVFTRGTTESINLVSYALEDYFNEGDVILLTIAEHHSNIVPWQFLAKRKNLKLVYAKINNNYNLDIEDFYNKVKEFKPRLIAATMCSNVLGSVFPVKDIISGAKSVNALVLLDGAQYVAHNKVNVNKLDVDFLCFSGHKMYGPTGIGVLYAKRELLEMMKPFQGGGEMISEVTLDDTTFADIPYKFEAGTPAIAEVIALGEAVNFINQVGIENIYEHEKSVFEYAISRLSSISYVDMYSSKSSNDSGSVISFNIDGVHPHDFASIADNFGVQIRSGFHCAMPLLNYLKVNATNRISLGMYSDKQDIDMLIDAILESRKIFKVN